MPSATSQRKDSHLDLCASEEVEPSQNRTLLECVQLIHCAMPEMATAEVNLSTPFMGKVLKVPLMITGMTGGTDRAAEVNRDLATLAEDQGLAFGVGSQRPMSEDSTLRSSFHVRSVAPTAVVIGNIGLRQAIALGLPAISRLAEGIGADGLALHLNAAQELTQPEGDRDFRGGYAMVGQLARHFGPGLLVKETGCGISPQVARRLFELGVMNIDVSGLGGTSWVRVEQLRAQGVAAEVGESFSGWGIPTAAAIASVRTSVPNNLTLVASGGIRTGLDVAKALSLGADLAGMALPLFRAQQQGGVEGAKTALETVLTGLRQAMLLTGSKSPSDLRTLPKIITGELKDWLAGLQSRSVNV